MRPFNFATSKNHGGGTEAMSIWGPRFCAVLGAMLGTEVALHISADYEALLADVERGVAQAAWLPPLLQARAEASGARLVAVTQRAGWLTYRSAVLVRRDAPWRDVGSLRGVRAAWVDPHSASGYFFPRLELVSKGATFASETFYGLPERTFAAVAADLADLCACFVSNPTADEPGRAAADVARSAGAHGVSLRILHVTDQIPPDGIALSRSVDPLEAERIAAALVAMHQTEQGKNALRELLHADRFVALTDSLRATLRSWMDAAAARVA
jgi:ABC-type phosphate/phosphonate transport system substrate-binding protein